jgi:hypothetical protein
MLFLGNLETPLVLDSFTIGPMGNTVLLPDDRPDALSEHLGLFQALKVETNVLRVDSYPISPASSVFSARLTTIEVFSAPYKDTQIAIYELWGTILRSTPNLTSLTLWHPSSQGYFLNEVLETWHDTPISLPSLENLNLNSMYLEIALLLAYSPLPKLERLRLDSSASRNFSLYIDRLAAVAPHISSLAISCPRKRRGEVGVWKQALQKLKSLQQLTFFEMDTPIITAILSRYNLPATLTDVRLERMYISSLPYWPPYRLAEDRTLKLNVVGYDQTFTFGSRDGRAYTICEDDVDVDEPDSSSEVIHSSRGPNITVTGDLLLVRVSTLVCRNFRTKIISKWVFAGS